MQTFLISENPLDTAMILDMRRLGKQRVEAIQIARSLLYTPGGWKNHPAVKMWAGYEPYLVKVYLRSILQGWKLRGGNNIKAKDAYIELHHTVEGEEVIKPWWSCEKLYTSHKSNLLRKDPQYYALFAGEVSPDIPYFWPTAKEDECIA